MGTQIKLFFVFIGVFFAICARAQQPVVSPTPTVLNDEGNAFEDTAPGLKTLNISVIATRMDQRRYFTGLKKPAFELYVGKEKVPIKYFARKDEPLSAVVLFDLSGSTMVSSRKNVNEALYAVEGVREFINRSHLGNEYALIGFSDKVNLILDFTSDRNQIRKALIEIRDTGAKGRTRFYDALEMGILRLRGSIHPKKVLLIVSDGQDNISDHSLKRAVSMLRKSNIMAYAVDMLTSRFDFISIEGLEASRRVIKLTSATGGGRFVALDMASMRLAFQSIALELRSQYQIGFSYEQIGKKDKWRKLKVKVNIPKAKRKGLGKVLVNARKGFYY